MEIPDILALARAEAQARTNARVGLLPPQKGDFWLSAPPGASLSFEEGGGLVLCAMGGRLQARMDAIWYERAVAAWRTVAVPMSLSADADAHLCGMLLSAEESAHPLQKSDWPLLREVMEVPHLLRSASAEHRQREARRLAHLLRQARSDALRQGRSTAALSACARMIAQLLTVPAALPMDMSTVKERVW